MSIRYIGSKARIAPEIIKLVGKATQRGTFVDAFAGTGAVAALAAEAGWHVRINDHLHSAVVITSARLTGAGSAPFAAMGGYDSALRSLLALRPREGFISKQYSPISRRHAGVERRYFTVENAGRIDAIRSQIRAWRAAQRIDDVEERVLIADLLLAASRVANTAGTFGCFLQDWSPNATKSLEFVAREFPPLRRLPDVQCGDVSKVRVSPQDTVYLDPPYTKRQYAAYYHVLETIAIGDAPCVEGVTGLRPWIEKASDFCYRRRALQAITNLIHALPAWRILLSYSDQGHVDLDDLMKGLHKQADVAIHSMGSIGRYRPNGRAAANGGSVTEYVIEVTRDRVTAQRSTPHRCGAA